MERGESRVSTRSAHAGSQLAWGLPLGAQQPHDDQVFIVSVAIDMGAQPPLLKKATRFNRRGERVYCPHELRTRFLRKLWWRKPYSINKLMLSRP